MKYFVTLTVFLFLSATFKLFAQPKLSTQHYGFEDGLPQKSVADIAQDRKGFMWFSTTNGISKFDGVTFRSYLANKEDDRGNRFDKIQFDAHGYLWIRSHENEVYRFDPGKETFNRLSLAAGFKNVNFSTRAIITTPRGKTWLIGRSTGCVCFKDTAFTPVIFNTRNHRLLNNEVEQVFEDAEGNSWILTKNGLYRFSADLGIEKSFFTSGSAFLCAAETGNEIWFGSQNGSVYVYDKRSGSFRSFSTGIKSDILILTKLDDAKMLICPAGNELMIRDTKSGSTEKFTVPANANIRSSYVDRHKNIWLETSGPGVSKFDPVSHKLKHFEIKMENLRDNLFVPGFLIWEDINDRVWIQQYGGGFGCYDAAKDQIIPIADLLPGNTNRFSDMLYDGLSDKQGNLWISTRSQGVEKITFQSPVFKFTVINPLGNNNVRSILEDHHHRIWVATKDEKITIYRDDLTKIGCITENGTIGEGKSLGGIAYSMIEAADGNIWIATKGRGVYKLISQGNKYTVRHYQYNKNDIYSLGDDKVYRVYQDSYKRIWIGTYSAGLNLVDARVDGRFYNFRNLFKNYPINLAKHVRSIAEDRSGMLYAGTTHGLLVFPSVLAEKGPDQLKFYRQGTAGLSGIDIYDVCATSDGHVYLAISGSGFDRVAGRDAAGYPNRFYNYSAKNGLVSELTSQIKEDHNHRLWIISESNIMRFTPWKNTFENYPDIAKALKEESFSEGGDITTASGNILAGTTGGFICIYPDRVKPDAFQPYMAFTNFQLANRDVPVGASSPLNKNIDEVKAIKLNHRQNFISIEFAALDFADTKQIKYAYRLDDVDSNWVYTGEQSAKYINIGPGKYTFYVRSTNSKGIWLNNERRLDITIVPAVWQTWWAKTLYLLIALAIIFFVSRWVIVFYRLKDRLLIEKEQMEMKTSFFTDISHEIRTPLTMIVAPVEHILENESISQPVNSQLQLVLKNSRRMLRLVSQILDFRKIQSQLLVLHQIAIGTQVADIVADFSGAADLQGIELKVNDQSQGKTVWIDPESLEKMMFNLLSNAVKHTPRGHGIEVNIFLAGEKVALQVKDQGHGMSGEIIRKLFSRFVSYNPDKTKPGTGIGLSIVKEIVDRHGAEITVESKEDKGSTFTIMFAAGTAHFAGLENIVLSAGHEDAPAEVKGGEITAQPEEKSEETILIVEDDDDLRHYIADLLSTTYKVLQAEDGEAGIAIARKEMPDFIISDIMMPKVNGFEFLESLRNTPLTSHIPLIFLTAKADPDTEIAAYERGADALMTKPFTIKLLRSRIKTIIDQRKRLYVDAREKSVSPPDAAPNQRHLRTVDLNERFLLKINEEIQKHISQGEFSVDDLISTMPMSRTVFVKKLKSLTGQSPVEYIRTVKIKHAAQLIKTKQYSIKEVSHMIGISDTKYFSQRFKEIMGMLPKDYKDHGG